MMPPGMIEVESDDIVLSRSDLSHEIGRSRVYGVEAKQRLIEAQEQMSALFTILRRVLTFIYRQEAMATCGNTSMLNGDEHKFRESKTQLDTWYHDNLMLPISERDSALGSPLSLDDGTEQGGPQHDPTELLVSLMYAHYE